MICAPGAALRPIQLEELVQRAELLARQDRKYLVSTADLPQLMDCLPSGTRVLEIDGRQEFDYQSVYFDTPDLDSYLDTVFGRRRRFKVRVRSYLDSQRHYLEVKTRGPRGITSKQRTSVAPGDQLLPPVQRLGPDTQGYVRAALHQAGIRTPAGRGSRLGVALTTRYRRSTLYVPSASSRITIDTDLAWFLPYGPKARLQGLAIVESKSPGSVSEVDRVLWALRYRPCSLSKYGTGLAALRPELPANRWRSVLRHHLQPAMEMR